MSALRAKLQTFFGTVSLPALVKSIVSAKSLIPDLQLGMDSSQPSLFNSTRSHNSL